MNHTYFKKQSQILEKQIQSIEDQLQLLPQQDFYCTHHKNYSKWYQTDGKKSLYIPKSNRPLAEKLAQRKYLSLLQQDLLEEKKAIDKFIKQYHPDQRASDSLLYNSPAFCDLLSSHLKPFSQEIQDWIQEPFEPNPYYPEKCIHKTPSGNLVRSKSELLIDMSLYKYKIPFRYEAPLQLESALIHPDFTIKHAITGVIYYWEHFGMMDDPDYAKKAASKIQLYSSYGIIPSVNLIITYETKEHPLDIDLVENLIQFYFL